MAYGFEINDASGVLSLDSDISTIRIVHTEFCLWNFSGNISVPNFDSTKGEYYIRPHLVAGAAPTDSSTPIQLITTGTNYDYDFKGTLTSTGGYHEAGYFLSFQNNFKPTLSWNNSTKLMNVTPPVTGSSLQKRASQHRRWRGLHNHIF